MNKMDLREEDLRITTYRTDFIHWIGCGKMVHIPTGISIEFNETWCDQSGRQKAYDQLTQAIAKLETPKGTGNEMADNS
jgi:protein subunit release factor A